MHSNSNVIRVCVLCSSYEDSDSELREYEGNLLQTPQHYFDSNKDCEYIFELNLIKKATAYRQIRQLVMSCKYDVFYNQCDGAKDEDRAGVEVVQALEEFNVPFTGAMSKYYEMSKPDMKLVAHYYNIDTAKYAVLEPGDEPAEACAHMRFPMIIKHISGYSSVGMDKSCKVYNVEELTQRANQFVRDYQFALVEEFITGDEATILVCNDESQEDQIRVLPPAIVDFPENEDFKHFELKWASYEGMQWRLISDDDPALPDMICIARKAFKRMMGGVGYGRVDVRIERMCGDEQNENSKSINNSSGQGNNNENNTDSVHETSNCLYHCNDNENNNDDNKINHNTSYQNGDLHISQNNKNYRVVFLEINPNCGIMYPPGEEGSADWILKLNKQFHQREFAIVQIREALRRCELIRPLFVRRFHPRYGYHLRAVRDIPAGTVVLRGEGEPQRLCTKPFAQTHYDKDDYDDFIRNAWPVGQDRHYYALWDHDPSRWRAVNHSCNPNMAFARVALHTKCSSNVCNCNTALKYPTENSVNDKSNICTNNSSSSNDSNDNNMKVNTNRIINKNTACELQESKSNNNYNITTLDVCAIRAIAKGEELTMDYRTFMDSLMPPFKCFCGCANCAGVIAPDNVLFQSMESDEYTNKKMQDIFKKEKLCESESESANQSSCAIHLLNKVEKLDYLQGHEGVNSALRDANVCQSVLCESTSNNNINSNNNANDVNDHDDGDDDAKEDYIVKLESSSLL